MRIDQFIYLITISKVGSISAAAEQLHVSQPTISQSLHSLESELGTKLFNRSKRGTFPTETGKMIIKKAETIVNALEEIKEVARNSNQLIDNLSLATIPTLGMSILPKALAKYKKKFPGVTIDIFEGGTYQIEKLVATGSINLGLVAASDKEHYKDNKDIHFEYLSTGQIMVCVGKNSKLSSKSSIRFEEIINHPIVTFNPEYRLYHRTLNILKKYGEPNILFKSANTEVVKNIVSEGVAIGFCNNLSIKSDPYFLSGRIVPIPIKGENVSFIFGWIHSKNRHFSIAGKKFVELLKAIWPED